MTFCPSPNATDDLSNREQDVKIVINVQDIEHIDA